MTDPCNADKVCMPAAQLFFIERFMQPTLEAFRPAAPSFYRMALPWLADTKAKWLLFKEAGVKMPHQGYPALQPEAAATDHLCPMLEGSPGCFCKGDDSQQEQQQEQQ